MPDDLEVDSVLEAEDSLAVRLKSLNAAGPRPKGPLRDVLQRQACTVVDGASWLEGGLALIEVDGVSNAVLIRSKKPAEGRYVQIVLRKGESVRLEAIGGSLHLSRENYRKLTDLVERLFDGD